MPEKGIVVARWENVVECSLPRAEVEFRDIRAKPMPWQLCEPKDV